MRAKLGWLAVSAEDDTPHRPINMPAPPYEQYEVRVSTGGRVGDDALLRGLRCSLPPPAAMVSPAPRPFPNDPVPEIPPEDPEVLLFLHGHSSGAEEALDLIPHLQAYGLERGKRYSVIAFDLPNNGYSETFDHTTVAPVSATTYPKLHHPRQRADPARRSSTSSRTSSSPSSIAVEGVCFINNKPGIKQRIAAVIGGSLGGNLGLRLGRRKPTPDWLHRTCRGAPRRCGSRSPRSRSSYPRAPEAHCMVECEKPETDELRFHYFIQVYDKEAPPSPAS